MLMMIITHPSSVFFRLNICELYKIRYISKSSTAQAAAGHIFFLLSVTEKPNFDHAGMTLTVSKVSKATSQMCIAGSYFPEALRHYSRGSRTS